MSVNNPSLIEIKDEGTSQGQVTALDFVGASIAATVSGTIGTITVTASSGSSGVGPPGMDGADGEEGFGAIKLQSIEPNYQPPAGAPEFPQGLLTPPANWVIAAGRGVILTGIVEIPSGVVVEIGSLSVLAVM